MPLTEATRTELNQKLHTFLSATGAVKDYLSSLNAMRDCLDHLTELGWTIRAWRDRADLQANPTKPTVGQWSDAGMIELRRSYPITVTRSKEHQALVEARGEVAPGDNTYTSIHTEIVQASLNARPAKSTEERVSTIIEAMALAMLHPMIVQPTNRVMR